MNTEYEWDEEKNSLNKEERKLSFETAVLIWDGYAFEWEDRRFDYGENRIRAVGEVNGRVIFVVYTWRDGRRRIITAWKANKRDQQKYREALARRLETGDDS